MVLDAWASLEPLMAKAASDVGFVDLHAESSQQAITIQSVWLRGLDLFSRVQLSRRRA